MDVRIERLDNGNYIASYVDTSGDRPKLRHIGDECDAEHRAIKNARQFLEERGLKRGDEIWEAYGTIHRYTGKKWRVEHVSGY